MTALSRYYSNTKRIEELRCNFTDETGNFLVSGRGFDRPPDTNQYMYCVSVQI